MANANTPFGMKPVKTLHGHMTGATEIMYVPSSDATAIYIGDPVLKAGSADANGVPSAGRAAAAGAISGVCVGILPDATGTVPKYRAASTTAYILVCTDPAMVYEVQEDAVGGALAAADVGLNADIAVANGSAITGLSGTMLDTSTKATTNTLPLKIRGFAQRPDNAIGANAKVLVTINASTETAGTTGV